MGSLMAGWNSPVRDLKSEMNRSITKEEIAAFWRMKKIKEEELFLLRASYNFSKEDKNGSCENEKPLPSILIVNEEDTEPLLKKHGWWISSKWAFLNEPVMTSREASYNYIAQFHVARKHIDTFSLPPATDGICA